MVRIKHRYLLINILYPGSPSASTSSKTISDIGKKVLEVPDVVQFHAPTSDILNASVLAKMIREGVGELFGEWGLGVVAGGLKVNYLSTATSTAIIRVSRDHYRLVWAALTFVTKLPKPMDVPCVVRVVRCSGTIRKAEEEAVRRAREDIVRAKIGGGSDVDVFVGKSKAFGGLSGHGGANIKGLAVERDEDDVDMVESDDDG